MNLFHRTLAAAAAMAVAAAAWGAPALKPALPAPKKHTSEAPAKVAQGVPAKTGLVISGSKNGYLFSSATPHCSWVRKYESS